MWPARSTPQQRIGWRSERLAVQYLTAAGYRIEATNVRFPVGEIDIIAQDGRALCFIEVRSRASLAWGGPLDSITARKRQRLIRAARWYLARTRAAADEIRFDVVAIHQPDGGRPTIELIRGAFDAT